MLTLMGELTAGIRKDPCMGIDSFTPLPGGKGVDMLVLGYGTHHLCQLGCAIDRTTGGVDIHQDGVYRRICCGLQQGRGGFLHAAQPYPADGSNSFLAGRYLTQHRSMNTNGSQSVPQFVRLSLFVNSVTLRRRFKQMWVNGVNAMQHG